MIKAKTILEFKINERVYALELSPDSPLGEAFDAICQMQAYVVAKMQEAQKSMQAQIQPPLPVTDEVKNV